MHLQIFQHDPSMILAIIPAYYDRNTSTRTCRIALLWRVPHVHVHVHKKHSWNCCCALSVYTTTTVPVHVYQVYCTCITNTNRKQKLVEDFTKYNLPDAWLYFFYQSLIFYSLHIGVVFNQLDGSNFEYTIRLRQPSDDSWDTGSRGSTTQLEPRTSK